MTDVISNTVATPEQVTTCQTGNEPSATSLSPEQRAIRNHYQAINEVRRGVCLLNAGCYDEAEAAFSLAALRGPNTTSLASCLAACYIGKKDWKKAVGELHKAATNQEATTGQIIRHALAVRAAGASDTAVRLLTTASLNHPEDAELHFQLGTLLTDQLRYREAEAAFAKAVRIDPHHSDALMNLAMCCGERRAPDEALTYLLRAQAQRPYDTTIALMVAHAARATHEGKNSVGVRAMMPDPAGINDCTGMDELAAVVARDPDFVDAFLSLPSSELNEDIYLLLLKTVERVIGVRPREATLHYHRGQLLQRLGRRSDATAAFEAASAVDPNHRKAQIAWAKCCFDEERYQQTVDIIQGVIERGGTYADVYYLLGSAYRELGQTEEAREAFALAIGQNSRYEAAKIALHKMESAGIS